MRVLVTGATGFIGKKLCATLIARGDEVVVLSRNANRAKQTLPMAVSAFAWNPLTEPAPPEAFAGVDAVVNLLGESVGQKWNEKVKKRIRDSRVVGTRNLVETMRSVRARTGATNDRPTILVSGSAIGFYGNRDDEELTEISSSGDGFLVSVSKEWEAEAMRAQEAGVRTVLLRTGVVLERDGGALQQMLLPFKLGFGGPTGNGRQWFAWIHRDDVVGLVLHAIDNANVNGPLNATAPNPVTNKEFAKTLGKVLRRPAFMPTPPFAMRLMFGEFVDAELLASKRVLPRRALETGYEFQFPELGPALRAILH